MNRVLRLMAIAGLALGLLVLAGCSGSASTPASTPTTSTGSSSGSSAGSAVSISNFAFAPAALTVKVGTKVTWTNNDSVAHTVTSDSGAFDSGQVAPGATYSFTFDKAGAFAYHCSVHPSMTAQVTVQ